MMNSGNREQEVTLNQLLYEMDGFEENNSIIVVAATNDIKLLDSALLRPGRFDHKIEINLPNLQERVEIMRIHLRNKQHCIKDSELLEVADMTEGLTGAELENVINLSALQMIRRKKLSSSSSSI